MEHVERRQVGTMHRPVRLLVSAAPSKKQARIGIGVYQLSRPDHRHTIAE